MRPRRARSPPPSGRATSMSSSSLSSCVVVRVDPEAGLRIEEVQFRGIDGDLDRVALAYPRARGEAADDRRSLRRFAVRRAAGVLSQLADLVGHRRPRLDVEVDD